LPKFTNAERTTVKSLVAALTIKRIPENEIIKAIFEHTNKTITIRYLSDLRQQIKKESYHWYKTMREGQYDWLMSQGPVLHAYNSIPTHQQIF
jgi:hypothetical protein